MPTIRCKVRDRWDEHALPEILYKIIYKKYNPKTQGNVVLVEKRDHRY